MDQHVIQAFFFAVTENAFLHTWYVMGSRNAVMVMTKTQQHVSRVLLSSFAHPESALTWKMFVTELIIVTTTVTKALFAQSVSNIKLHV